MGGGIKVRLVYIFALFYTELRRKGRNLSYVPLGKSIILRVRYTRLLNDPRFLLSVPQNIDGNQLRLNIFVNEMAPFGPFPAVFKACITFDSAMIPKMSAHETRWITRQKKVFDVERHALS